MFKEIKLAVTTLIFIHSVKSLYPKLWDLIDDEEFRKLGIFLTVGYTLTIIMLFHYASL